MEHVTPQSVQLGALVRKRRLVKGVSLRQTAVRLGVSAMWLSKLERGYIGTPHPQRLRRIGLVLGLPYPLLLQRAGYPAPTEMEKTLLF